MTLQQYPPAALLAAVLLTPLGCGDHRRPGPTAPAAEPPVPLPELPADDPAEPDRALSWREVPLPPGSTGAVLAFSPDGKQIATVGRDTIYVASADTGALVTRMRVPEERAGLRLVFTADGKTLASGADKDEVVRFWDTRTGKQVRELPLPRPRDNAWIGGPLMDIAPGAGRVAVRGYGQPYGHVAVLDAADGSLVRRVDGRQNYPSGRFGPDGKVLTVFTAAGMKVGAWEVDTGKELLFATAENVENGKHLVFPDAAERVAHGMNHGGFLSPDNRFVFTDGYPVELKHGENEQLLVWRLGTCDAAPAARVPTPGAVWSASVVASPDGRLVAVCTRTRFGLYDLLRDEYRPEFAAPADKCSAAVLAPDGATLAVVARSTAPRADGGTLSAYLARIPKVARPVPSRGEWTAADDDFLWGGLSSRNEFRRGYCVRTLLGRPDRAAALSRERLRPVPKTEAEWVDGTIGKLDDDDPDVRDRATAELREVVHTFGPLLEAAHREAPPGEVRNRLAIVLNRAKLPPAPPGLEAEIRQVEFLERLGTPAARQLLAEIAAGAPGARLTEAAAAALKRLPEG